MKRERKFQKSFDKKPFQRSSSRLNHQGHKAKKLDDSLMSYYGLYSCKELIRKRPNDIERIYLIETLLPDFKSTLHKIAQQKKPYRIVVEDELYRLTDSIHHEGICVVAKKLYPKPINSALMDLKKASCLAFLDGVENPHNLGAILRSAAHFGIKHIITPEAKPLSPSSYRIAREGAEHTRILSSTSPIEDLNLLKKMSFTLIAASSHEGKALNQTPFPKKSVLIIGNESKGLSQAILDICDLKVHIKGSGVVDSLNVASAFSILAFQAQATSS